MFDGNCRNCNRGELVYCQKVSGGYYKRRLRYSPTLQVLAAEDSIEKRSSILPRVVQCITAKRLRRDFKTQRIRSSNWQTMPVLDDALLKLDNMFEMARYNQDEMGAQHQQAAPASIRQDDSRISSGAIPNR